MGRESVKERLSSGTDIIPTPRPPAAVYNRARHPLKECLIPVSTLDFLF